MSTCYVFKSRLQEYAQKAGLPTPVYETIKEGPSHEPTFRSTVILNDVRYDSLPGFFNRKAAEQSAAEVALMQLAQSGEMKDCISQPVHETGLCKNLLQEYAQKMNYAIPMYECRKEEPPNRLTMFSCTVEVGGMKYIGAAARTKKEAEIKAARTALLAIQYGAPELVSSTANSTYTVLPVKKKVTDLGISNQETAAALKPKKGRFKKKSRKKRHKMDGTKNNHDGLSSILGGNKDNLSECGLDRSDVIGNQEANTSLLMPGAIQNERSWNGDIANSWLVSCSAGNSQLEVFPASNFQSIGNISSSTLQQCGYEITNQGGGYMYDGGGCTQGSENAGIAQASSM